MTVTAVLSTHLSVCFHLNLIDYLKINLSNRDKIIRSSAEIFVISYHILLFRKYDASFESITALTAFMYCLLLCFPFLSCMLKIVCFKMRYDFFLNLSLNSAVQVPELAKSTNRNRDTITTAYLYASFFALRDSYLYI